MGRFVVKKGELMMLFNALIDLGLEKNLWVTVPLLDHLKLCKLDLSGREVGLSQFIPSREYEGQLERRFKRVGRWELKEEFADYGELVSVLYQSGVLHPSGLEALEETMRWATRGQSLVKGGDVFYLAFDTNTLRDRLFSNHLRGYLGLPHVDFVLCETVREELANRREKIQKGFLRDLKQVGGEMVETCFRNQNRLEDRLRYIGYLEYNQIRSITGCEQLSGPEEEGRGSAAADEAILEAYSQFAQLGRKVVLLSRDNELIRMSTGHHNLIPLLLERDPFPRMGEVAVGWERFLSLLALLGNLYGRIDLRMGDVELAQLYGVWAQKDVREWEGEMLRIQTEKGAGLSASDAADIASIDRAIADQRAILEKMSEGSTMWQMWQK